MHTPVCVLQQTCVQGLVVQVLPAGPQMPLQLACVVTLQPCGKVQQRPIGGQGLGVQVRPMGVVLIGQTPKTPVMEHAPVMLWQQAREQMMLHEAPTGPHRPGNGPERQLACVVMMHPLGCRQHGATGGQGLGVQETPVSTGVAPAGHELPPKIWKQAPVLGLQHAFTHGLGWQAVFGSHRPGRLLQFACVVVVQMIVPRMQHALTGGQGLGVQVVPATPMVLVGHGTPKPTTPHWPVLMLQQTRTQGLGLHKLLASHWPLQAVWTVTVQVTAPCWQHAPKIGQGFGKQGVPVGCSVQPMNGQVLVFANIWQTPVVLLQQVALGGMQGLFGTQVEPTPCQMPVQTVWACTTVQMNG